MRVQLGDRATELPLDGINIVESTTLPLEPSPGQWARRFVRHGMADVLAWLGEHVGPRPDDRINALQLNERTLLVSPELAAAIRRQRGMNA